MVETLDKETATILTEGERWARFLKSEEWGMVRDKFLEHIVELSDLTTIVGNTPDELYLNIKSRKEVLQILYSFLQEMRGEGEAGQFNSEVFSKERNEDIIRRFEVSHGG